MILYPLEHLTFKGRQVMNKRKRIILNALLRRDGKKPATEADISDLIRTNQVVGVATAPDGQRYEIYLEEYSDYFWVGYGNNGLGFLYDDKGDVEAEFNVEWGASHDPLPSGALNF